MADFTASGVPESIRHLNYALITLELHAELTLKLAVIVLRYKKSMLYRRLSGNKCNE
jgi:hypothetical protein